ncbi:hypothetical protein LP420_08800 [Massilia sp. B-10]|nr:hypothetical protein LP420_08800 [Massilia sp. B-10]
MTKIVFLPVLALAMLASLQQDHAGRGECCRSGRHHRGTGRAAAGNWLRSERADPPNFITRMTKAGVYEMCAGLARARNKPVKPFPVMPDDYEDEARHPHHQWRIDRGGRGAHGRRGRPGRHRRRLQLPFQDREVDRGDDLACGHVDHDH